MQFIVDTSLSNHVHTLISPWKSRSFFFYELPRSDQTVHSAIPRRKVSGRSSDSCFGRKCASRGLWGLRPQWEEKFRERERERERKNRTKKSSNCVHRPSRIVANSCWIRNKAMNRHRGMNNTRLRVRKHERTKKKKIESRRNWIRSYGEGWRTIFDE